MEAAIVGEEQFTQKQICSYIRNHRPDCRMEIFATGEELLAAGKKFDLIFLDIQLRGFNGIETARIYRKQREDTVLIFFADKWQWRRCHDENARSEAAVHNPKYSRFPSFRSYC